MGRFLNAFIEWVRREFMTQTDGGERWARWQEWLREIPPQAYSDHRVSDVTRRQFQAAMAAAEGVTDD